MVSQYMEQALTLLIAVFGTSGFWVFAQELVRKKDAERNKTLEQLSKDVQSLKDSFSKDSELTLALGAEKLNFLCNKYIDLGYIPLREYSTFKTCGDAYLNAGGNHGIDGTYNWVIENLAPLDTSK